MFCCTIAVIAMSGWGITWSGSFLSDWGHAHVDTLQSFKKKCFQAVGGLGAYQQHLLKSWMTLVLVIRYEFMVEKYKNLP
jgi:hypothetical protein